MNILEQVESKTEVSELHELLDELTDYARTYDKERCFPKHVWTRESTKNFLHYHLNQGTLLFVRNEKGQVVGLTTWWRWNKSDLKNIDDDEIFQNPPKHYADGDLLYLSDVVTTDPMAMKSLAKELVKRNPDYADIEIWGTRKNKRTGIASRVRYTRRILDLIK
tara:strand:+ start:78 stop:569 length:492 start_codon:yes stop_codon:yes gene_type:complete